MYGTFEHTLDSKGRVSIPAKFREELGVRFYVTKGLDNCLFVYAESEWNRMADKLKAMPVSKGRRLQRNFFGAAASCELDPQGRILIPPSLREYALLDRELTIIGCGDRAEIWDTTHYNEINGDYTSDDMEADYDLLS